MSRVLTHTMRARPLLATQSTRPALTFDPLPIIVQSPWRRAADRLSPLDPGSAGPRPRGPSGRGLDADWPASAAPAQTPPTRRRLQQPRGQANTSDCHLPRIALNIYHPIIL